MTQQIVPRLANGTFAPGSGGRPRGSKNKVSLTSLKAVQDLSSEAVAKLRERVTAGDMGAIKLVLEYTLPKGGRTVELDSTDPNAIIDAAAMGEISPDEAARLAQATKTASEAAELKDLKRQVEELELLITSLSKR
ncbi:hypothetical protein [Novosphingobium sp. HII-3]|uniref:hypothetical protein n=1 Tax=Novosphingobium sp. HII-3 TaxID=2075565 RepID=UPI000CDA2BC3|nr:hypothetical protein [Novosphingobium sp. HII-3]